MPAGRPASEPRQTGPASPSRLRVRPWSASLLDRSGAPHAVSAWPRGGCTSAGPPLPEMRQSREPASARRLRRSGPASACGSIPRGPVPIVLPARLVGPGCIAGAAGAFAWRVSARPQIPPTEAGKLGSRRFQSCAAAGALPSAVNCSCKREQRLHAERAQSRGRAGCRRHRSCSGIREAGLEQETRAVGSGVPERPRAERPNGHNGVSGRCDPQPQRDRVEGCAGAPAALAAAVRAAARGAPRGV